MQLIHVPDLPTPQDSQPQCMQDAESAEPEEPDIHYVPDDNKTKHHPCHGRCKYGEAQGMFQKHLSQDWIPWHPFKNARDFELGRWMIDSGLAKTAIHDYLQYGLDNDPCTSFHSVDELWTLLENHEYSYGS
jgi:hypothetical protein